jgi:hypothetical protein
MGRIEHMTFEVQRNPKEVLSFKEARRRLKVPTPIFEALLKSKPLRRIQVPGFHLAV